MLNTDEKKKLVLVFIWTVFALVAYFRFLVGPQLAHLSSQKSELRAVQERLDRLELDEERYKTLVKGRDRLRQTVAQHENLIARQDEMLKMLRDISALAEERDVHILGIKEVGSNDLPAQAGEPVQKTIDLKLSAGYHDLGAFINDLERMTPVLQVVGLDIRSIKDDPQRHSAALLLKNFVLPSGENS